MAGSQPPEPGSRSGASQGDPDARGSAPGSGPAREPVHEVDRQQARLERRLAVGGFGILVALAVTFALARYGTGAAIVGAVIITGGAALLGTLWLALAALEWWAKRPSDD